MIQNGQICLKLSKLFEAFFAFLNPGKWFTLHGWKWMGKYVDKFDMFL